MWVPGRPNVSSHSFVVAPYERMWVPVVQAMASDVGVPPPL